MSVIDTRIDVRIFQLRFFEVLLLSGKNKSRNQNGALLNVWKGAVPEKHDMDLMIDLRRTIVRLHRLRASSACWAGVTAHELSWRRAVLRGNSP
jgi:hypothetical protein